MKKIYSMLLLIILSTAICMESEWESLYGDPLLHPQPDDTDPIYDPTEDFHGEAALDTIRLLLDSPPRQHSPEPPPLEAPEDFPGLPHIRTSPQPLPERTVPQTSTPDYRCTRCAYKGKSRDALVCHTIKMHVRPKIHCPATGCTKTFGTRSMIRKHIQNRHESDPSLIAQIVDRWNITQPIARQQAILLLGLQFREKTHTASAKIDCPHPGCSHQGPRSGLPGHIQAKHTEMKISCPARNCSRCYSSWSSLRMHINTKHSSDQYLLVSAHQSWHQLRTRTLLHIQEMVDAHIES